MTADAADAPPDLDTLAREAREALAAAGDEDAVEEWRRSVLGRSGALTGMLRGLGSLPPEERRAAGQAANALKRDLEAALERSCNTYFYELGARLDVDQIHRWATALGLGELSGVDLPFEARGLVPSRAWKRERRAEPWYPGETISVAIGQGQVGVTPMSLAVMMSTLVNGGRRITPRVLREFHDGIRWRPAPAGPAARELQLRPETLSVVKRGLWRVVNGAGTGRRGRIPGRDVLGKTGTAQVVSRAGRATALAARPEAGASPRTLRDHGWFVFAAPADDPQIAGVVFAEHADHGYLAAPIARHALDTFFAKREGRQPPSLPPAAPARPLRPQPRSPDAVDPLVVGGD